MVGAAAASDRMITVVSLAGKTGARINGSPITSSAAGVFVMQNSALS
jgi:hypothetical protein